MISSNYVFALTLPDEVRRWIGEHGYARSWRTLLSPGQVVIAQYGFDFSETWYYDPDDKRCVYVPHFDTVEEGERGEVIQPYEEDEFVWLIAFGPNRRWWMRWNPNEDAEYWSIVPQFPDPPDNDPARYERRLL